MSNLNILTFAGAARIVPTPPAARLRGPHARRKRVFRRFRDGTFRDVQAVQSSMFKVQSSKLALGCGPSVGGGSSASHWRRLRRFPFGPICQSASCFAEAAEDGSSPPRRGAPGDLARLEGMMTYSMVVGKFKVERVGISVRNQNQRKRSSRGGGRSDGRSND